MRNFLSYELPEIINKWRIVPRLIVAMYGWLFYEVAIWFMSLPNPNEWQAAFIATIVGASAGFFKFYLDSKQNNENKE